MLKTKNGLPWLYLSLLVLIVDQASKWLITQHLKLFESISIFPFLNFTLKYNTGAAFSFLMSAGGWQRWLFCGISLIVSVGIIIWLYYLPRAERWTGAALALILGGAIGNFYDRFTYGHVIDFIDFYIKDWHYATFNIADSAITVGAAMLAIYYLRNR